ncbi:hypothetical protein CEXT_751691 [Caerostris extrusa]|uniref:Uncharacterized protein n=1 Tax=Caerostris extrusa TaxID=172846 RepID=A0AAV4NNX7_CAEEX|nr:hypothetical protein CEXT_751691 [Caerostris extrusa]
MPLRIKLVAGHRVLPPPHSTPRPRSLSPLITPTKLGPFNVTPLRHTPSSDCGPNGPWQRRLYAPCCNGAAFLALAQAEYNKAHPYTTRFGKRRVMERCDRGSQSPGQLAQQAFIMMGLHSRVRDGTTVCRVAKRTKAWC